MLRTFVFVRHGQALKTANPPGKPVDNGLTLRGKQQALDAARWLQSQGIEPDAIVYTQTPRARETASIIVGHYGGIPRLIQTRSGFRDQSGLHKKLKQWSNQSDQTLLFCGHHSSQAALTKALSLPISQKERGVIVVDLQEWRASTRTF